MSKQKMMKVEQDTVVALAEDETVTLGVGCILGREIANEMTVQSGQAVAGGE